MPSPQSESYIPFPLNCCEGSYPTRVCQDICTPRYALHAVLPIFRVLPPGSGLKFGPLKPKLASVMSLASRSVSKRSAQQLCRAVTGCVYSVSAGVPVIASLPVQSCLAAWHSICLELPAAAVPMSLFHDGSKSAKRKAAEALLQSRFSSPGSSSPCLEHTPKCRQFSTSAHVRACSATAENEPCSVSGWCDFDVCLPHLNWNDVSTAAVEEVDNTASPHHLRLPKYQLPYGMDIYVVEKSNQIAEALRLLKDSMEDSIVSIDLEWKPDFVKDTSKVALMQLSSATCCLLIRTCKMKHELPAALLDFLRYACPHLPAASLLNECHSLQLVAWTAAVIGTSEFAGIDAVLLVLLWTFCCTV